MAFSVVGNYWY